MDEPRRQGLAHAEKPVLRCGRESFLGGDGARQIPQTLEFPRQLIAQTGAIIAGNQAGNQPARDRFMPLAKQLKGLPSEVQSALGRGPAHIHELVGNFGQRTHHHDRELGRCLLDQLARSADGGGVRHRSPAELHDHALSDCFPALYG